MNKKLPPYFPLFSRCSTQHGLQYQIAAGKKKGDEKEREKNVRELNHGSMVGCSLLFSYLGPGML